MVLRIWAVVREGRWQGEVEAVKAVEDAGGGALAREVAADGSVAGGKGVGAVTREMTTRA